MRYMIIVKTTEPAPPPSPEMLAEMGKLNQEMIEAGVMLGGEGLQPSSSGAKVAMQGGKLVVKDGPFTEAKELIGGFWIIKADSLEEAIGWVKKIPMWNEGEEVEVRRVSEVARARRIPQARQACQGRQARVSDRPGPSRPADQP